MAGSNPQKLNRKRRTLVVFLPWLGATEAAIAKYRKLYHDNGECEVYVHYSEMRDFLWPKAGLMASLKVLDEIKDILQKEEDQFCGIIIHAFSIGCFFYSLMIWQMRRHMDKYGNIWRCISMHVMDSPVVGTTTEMAVGVSKMMSQWDVIGTICKYIIVLYFAMTKAHTVSYYNNLLAEVTYHAPDVPSLLMTSNEDPLCLLQTFLQFCDTWRGSKYVLDKVWPDSKHARHFFFHHDEYTLLIKHMLEKSSQLGDHPLHSKL